MPTKTDETAATEEKTTTSTAKKGKYFYANGKRKTAVAKVRLYSGKGEITVNGKEGKAYFPVKTIIGLIKTPFKLTGTNGKYNAVITVQGGGPRAQAEAARHGIAKALVVIDPLNKPVLKKDGLLTRDSRVKERKKFGLKRARKAPQFSKR